MTHPHQEPNAPEAPAEDEGQPDLFPETRPAVLGVDPASGPEVTVYRLGSTPVLSAPGLTISLMHLAKSDLGQAVRGFAATWGSVPVSDAVRILQGEAQLSIDGDFAVLALEARA